MNSVTESAPTGLVLVGILLVGMLLMGPDLTRLEVTRLELTVLELTGLELTGPELTMLVPMGPVPTRPELTGPELTAPELMALDLTVLDMTVLGLKAQEFTTLELTGIELKALEFRALELTELEVTGLELTRPELILPPLVFPLLLLARVVDGVAGSDCGGLRLKENVGSLWMGGRGTAGGSSSSGSDGEPLIFSGAGWAVWITRTILPPPGARSGADLLDGGSQAEATEFGLATGATVTLVSTLGSSVFLRGYCLAGSTEGTSGLPVSGRDTFALRESAHEDSAAVLSFRETSNRDISVRGGTTVRIDGLAALLIGGPPCVGAGGSLRCGRVQLRPSAILLLSGTRLASVTGVAIFSRVARIWRVVLLSPTVAPPGFTPRAMTGTVGVCDVANIRSLFWAAAPPYVV